MIRLNYERFTQTNVGTPLRPDWTLKKRSAILSLECEGIRERGDNEPIHYSDEVGVCYACGEFTHVWTDDPELYLRHTMRCNYAYNPLGD